MTDNTGGIAFPLKGPIMGSDRLGMTLRDYFAAKAMQAYCSCPEWRRDVPQDGTARLAYEMADAMLKARGEVK